MVNKVILIGNVGMDPEIRTLESGVKMARLRLATTERIPDRQNNTWRDHAEWHTVILWRNTADTVDRYVKKGTQLYIEGRLRTREWTDKDGNKRYTTEIMADTMNLLGRRTESAEGGQTGYSAPQSAPSSMGYVAHPQANYAAQAPAATPAQPVMPDEDPDDMPF